MTSRPDTTATAHPGWSRLAFWGLGAAGATMLALFEWLQMRSMVPPEVRAAYRLWQWSSWLLWVPVVPLASALVRRMVNERARPAMLVMTLILGFLATLVYWSAGRTILSRFTGPPSVRNMPVGRVFVNHCKGVVLPGVYYLGIVGILGTIELRRRLRREALSAARLEADLARAELDQMRVQLHPQLLEDTLKTTADFVRSGASTQAVQLLARLSDVLRLTLATLGQERVALRQELEFLQAYLSLQQIRAPGRLRSRVDIPAEMLSAEVPSLALYQLAPAQPGAEVTEAADRLVHLRQRLEHLYQGDHVLQVRHENAGLLCTLDIPLVHVEAPDLFGTGGGLRSAVL